MAANAALVDSTAILKKKYNQPKVYWLSYKANPEIADVRKDETYGGENKVIAVQTETPQGAGVTIATAQANLLQGSYKKFTITHIKDYGVARVDGDALKGAKKNEDALIDLWKREMDGIIHTVTRSLAIHFWRNGTGSRAQISASATIASATLLLRLVSDISNFSVGMKVQATDTDGGTLRNAGAVVTLSAVNRRTGTITTAGGNWSVQIGAITVNDFLYRSGDLNGMVSGVQAWVPASDPSATTFFGLDRTSDVVRLGGQRLDAANMPMSEALIESISLIDVEMAGQQNELVAWMHPRDAAQYIKEAEGKVQYTRVERPIKGSSVKVGFKAIEAEVEGTSVMVRTSINVPRQKCFVTDWSTWALETMGPAPHIQDYDSNQFLRVSNEDSLEVRVAYYGQVSNAAPCGTVHISNFGVSS
jgi:hypothetical protein